MFGCDLIEARVDDGREAAERQGSETFVVFLSYAYHRATGRLAPLNRAVAFAGTRVRATSRTETH